MLIKVWEPLDYTSDKSLVPQSTDGFEFSPKIVLYGDVLGLWESAPQVQAWTRPLLSPRMATRLTPRPPSRPLSQQPHRNAAAALIPTRITHTLWDAPHATPPGERRVPREEEAAAATPHLNPNADLLKSRLHCPSSSSTWRRVSEPSSFDLKPGSCINQEHHRSRFLMTFKPQP